MKKKNDCPGNPKKRCRETSTRKLLEAGVEVFSKHGYDCATTKLVAKCAGINESLINRYFEGKAGLLLAIIKQYSECEAQEDPINSYPKGESHEKEIVNYFHASLEHYEENQDFLRVLVSRAMVDPKIGKEMSKQMNMKAGMPTLLQRLKDLKARGLIPSDVDVDRTGLMIKAQAFSLSFMFHIMLGMKREFVLDAMSDFAKTYAAGLSRK